MKSTTILSALALLLVAPIVSAQWTYPEDNGCRSPNNRKGTCINIKSCQAMISLLQTKPLTSEITNFLRKSQCGYDGNNPKVCCEQEAGGSAGGQTPSTPTQRPQTDSNSPPDVRNHPNLRLLDPNCGPINRDKIIGGQVAGINEFPWMALLAYDVGKRTPEFRCGGSIINKRYILTAAHCVTSLPSSLRLTGVRVGEHDITTDIDCQGQDRDRTCNEKHQDFGIEQVTYHPEYSRTKLHNDVAVIRLNRDIDFRPDNAQAICMPVGNAATINSQRLTVSGWGVTESRVSSTVMMKVAVPRFPQEECAKVYKRQTEIWHKQMCMGGEQGKDSCSGDSGGPLHGPTVYNGRTRFVQYGIVSFGVRNCGTQGFPGVYTRVDYYLDWILNTIRV